VTVDTEIPSARQVPPDLPPITEGLRIPPSGLGQMTLSDLGRGLLRYRPALVVIAAILLLAVVLPGPRRLIAEGFSSAPFQQSSTTDLTVEEDVPATGAAPGVAEAVTPMTTPFDATYDLGTSQASFDSPSATSGSFGSSDSNSGDFESSSSGATSSSQATSATTVAAQPLRISDATWATRTAGTPLATEGVPEGSLPVGKRLGQDDKQSFIRLSGTAATLTLRLAAPEGQRSADMATIQACPINNAGWYSGEAVAWDARPAYSTDGCIAGTRGADGSWTFDFGAIADRGGQRGFALVPGPDAPIDFQIAFTRG
jgi:hypothetical protein